MGTIAENLQRVRERIAAAAVRAGRKPEEVKLIAVTKTVAVPRMREALAAGVTAVGENRVQEARLKQAELDVPVEWHLIGHLQTNKVKDVIGNFSLIHSVDSYRLGVEIARRSERAGLVTPILVEVNTSGEGSKFGVTPADALELIQALSSCRGLEVRGLMTMAPFLPDPEQTRPYFRRLRELAAEIREALPEVRLDYLSMGMSNDFEVAVEEGANLVRIGSAIFGSRG